MRNHAKALSSAALLLLLAAPVAAGDLTPSAAPASTMVTLNDLDAAIGDATDARIPIDSLPGSGTSVHVVSAAGSYYLRGDVVGQPGKNGIEIGADNVQIDLNGFALVGGAGAQRGVVISAFGNLRGLVVRDGSIRGWPLGASPRPVSARSPGRDWRT
jgi:hypothetical protein